MGITIDSARSADPARMADGWTIGVGAGALVASALELTALLRGLDALQQRLALLDRSGRATHATRSFMQQISCPPDGQVVHDGVRELVRCVAALLATGRARIDTAEVSESSVLGVQGRYRVRATLVVASSPLNPAFLVAIDQPPPDPLTCERLRERFGLSKAQARVARLLASGLRNDEIAGRLFLSSHTVRHHIEQIRVKVGGHTRAAVATRLRMEYDHDR